MGLYVLGMHRSGTSAVTEALASLPFELPGADAMVGGDESNPRGHWEVESLVDFNQALLERAGATWLAPTTQSLTEMAKLSRPELGLDQVAEATFAEAFATDRWLFKDPRLSLTMPFWRHVLGPSPAVLLLRDPLAIARSLRARNDLAMPFGLALWERYLRSAVDSLAGMAVHVTTFSAVAAGGQPVLDLVEFAAKSVDVAIPDNIEERIHQVIDPNLRHHDGGPDTDHDLLSPQQRLLVEALHEAEGNHADFAVSVAEIDETPGLDLVFSSAAGFARSADALIASQRSELEADFAKREAVWSHDFTNQRERAERELSETSESLLGELDRLRNLLAVAEHSESGLHIEQHALEAEIERLRIEVATANHERNLASLELARINRRRAVQLATRVADGLRKVGILEKEELPAVVTPEVEHTVTPIVVGASNSQRSPFTNVVGAIDAGAFDRPLTVIIPVYNAVSALQRCLESVQRFTPEHVHLVVIDDASTDPDLGVVLDQLADRPNTTVLANETNQGFTRTVNRGLEHRDSVGGDVVILNSDTIVTPRWTQRLRSVAHEDPKTATVTPLSNAAGVFSFVADLPTGADHAAQVATLVTRGAEYLRPTAPTGNGFALFVKQEALADVPRLDAEAFPRGYGEENDFCMKLGGLGWNHVVADEIAIFHEESASFGDVAKAELIEAGLAVLDERYSTYRADAQNFVDSASFVAARANATAALVDPPEQIRPRSLVVMHDGGGGTDYHAADLMGALADDYEPLLLIPDGNDLVLWAADDPEMRIEITRWTLSKPWDVRHFRDDDVAAVVAEVLTRYSIDIVHIHHLIGHTFDLPRIARALGIPVVLTLHDFYMACPSVNLLDETTTFCGGTCTAGPGQCHTPVWLERTIDLKHRFVHLWRSQSTSVLHDVDALVTPSADTREHFARIFGPEVGRKVRAIEHGRDFDRPRALARSPRDTETISILLVGAINASKGAALAAEISAAGAARNVQIELLGEVEPGYEGGIISHGKYRRDELPHKLATLRPTFVGVFSVWAETHCYVVSEAWSCGIPVLVGPLGAPAERVRDHGGGVVVPTLEPDQIVEAAVAAARDRVGYARLAAEATVDNVRTTAEMGSDYRSLYGESIRVHGGWVDGGAASS